MLTMLSTLPPRRQAAIMPHDLVDAVIAGKPIMGGRHTVLARIVDFAEEHKNVLTLPATAIFKDGGKAFCVVVEGSRARRREIKVGPTEGKRTEVVSGIAEADAVVEANAGSLADGQPVERIATPTAGAKAKS